MAKTYLKTIITAGNLEWQIVRPILHRGDDAAARRAKRQLSSEAQKAMNAKYSWQELERQLAANYGPGDLWITLTYRDADLPRSEAEADANVTKFLRRWRAERKKRGQQLRVHWNAEHLHQSENYFEDGRWHHHLCVNATGEDYELIRRCWTWGDNVEIRALRFGGADSYEALARYMCKERPERKVGKHVWHHTRNILKYSVETFRVEADEPVQTPRGCEELDVGGRRNRFGRWRYVKFLRPFRPGQRRRARRRRRS